MFCPHCGVANPDEAVFCAQCGKGMRLAPSPVPAPAPSPVHPPPVLPYRWGRFQGWAMILIGVILIVAGIAVLSQPAMPGQDRQMALVFLMVGILFLPAAIGILKRRKFSLYLIEALLMISVYGFFALLKDHPDEASGFVPGIIFWSYYTYYFFRRRAELR